MHGYPLCLRYVTCRWHQVAARYPHTVLQTLRRISYYRKSFLSSVFSNFPYCKNAISSFIHDMLNGLNNTIQFIPFMTQSTADKLNKIAISRCKLVVSDVGKDFFWLSQMFKALRLAMLLVGNWLQFINTKYNLYLILKFYALHCYTQQTVSRDTLCSRPNAFRLLLYFK